MRRPYLADWLEAQGKNPSWFAKQILASKRVAYDWCRAFGDPERRIPTHGWMVTIFVFSKGAVLPTSFYDLPDLEPRRSAPADETQLDLVEMVRESEAA